MPSVSVTARDASGGTATTSVSYTVAAPSSSLKIIGMSAPAPEWANRVAEVGTVGLKARRIFADLVSGGRDQSTLIQQAVAAGQMPVVSYRPPADDFAGAAVGAYDTYADQTAAYLNSLGVEVAVVVFHEPMDNMAGPQYVAMQNRLTPRFKGYANLKVGPILNGFLLTQPNQQPGQGVDEFASYTTPALLNSWDFFGIDSYQPGTTTSPGSLMPHERVTKLKQWLATQGHAGMPWGIGEYNGFSAEAIAGMGDAVLSDPASYFACVWNVDAARAGILAGDRLTAFKATKSDPRVQK